MKRRISPAMFWLSTGTLSLGGAAVFAGPINPPVGPIASTAKPLSDVEPRTAINAVNTPGDTDSVYRITQSGSYYLTGNLNGVSGKSGIKISTSNVTIDLRGFTLLGANGSLDGIRADSGIYHKITIRDGTITGWGEDGIDLRQTSTGAASLIEGIHSFQNVGNGISGNYSGIIRRCTSSLNGGAGILAQDGSVIEGCSVRQCTGEGIRAERGSTVTDCVSQDNGSTGIHTRNGGSVSHCTATGNAAAGIFVDIGGAVTACQASNNVDEGIFARTGVVVSQCSCSSNSGYGILAAGGAVVSGCIITSNTADGIYASAFSGVGCTVLNNQCVSNGGIANEGAGINAQGAGNRVEGNNCTLNRRGIHILSAGNTIVRNSCSANATSNWDVVAGNVIYVISTTTSGAFTGNSGGVATPSTDPNANYTY